MKGLYDDIVFMRCPHGPAVKDYLPDWRPSPPDDSGKWDLLYYGWDSINGQSDLYAIWGWRR